MKTFDVEQLDSVTIVYNAFFILLNQGILIAMAFLLGIDSRMGWFNLPFVAIWLTLNVWSFLVWRREGTAKAFRFYARANISCFLFLAIAGFVLVGLSAA
jgi:hypothetical protein